ncbi:MAG: SGNH/GDSL hydrolase family protein [Deltaproteobacteria bacterium]|nr:SGNH/GDSL hydrolase family protein [Deltaproteobacteria bacterium]
MTARRLLKALISLSLTLLLVEGAVRLTDFDKQILGDPFKDGPLLFQMYLPDSFLQWRNRPGLYLEWSGVTLNDRGYRGPDVKTVKREGVRRIAVVGDSCTFGVISIRRAAFEMPRSYAELLQDVLDREAGPGRYEVLNYGVMGYTTYHGLRLLRRQVIHDDPDYLVIRFGWNDHLASAALRPFSSVTNPWLEKLEDLAYGSRLYALLRYERMPAEAVTRGGSWVPSATPIVQVTPEAYARHLSRMIDIGRAHGTRPILLDAPPAPLSPEILADKQFLKGTGYNSYDRLIEVHAMYQAIAARVATEKGVPFVRTEAPPGEAPRYFSRYDIAHPNAEGHARIAKFLHEKIRAMEEGE